MRPPFPIRDPKVRRDQPLIMSQLGIVMIVLAVGLVLSIPAFLCELLKGSAKKPTDQQLPAFLPAYRKLTQTEVTYFTFRYYGRSLEEQLS